VIFGTCYQGRSNNDSTKRSFAQGIKAYYEEYQLPVGMDVPFVSFIPIEPRAYVLTTVRRLWLSFLLT